MLLLSQELVLYVLFPAAKHSTVSVSLGMDRY